MKHIGYAAVVAAGLLAISAPEAAAQRSPCYYYEAGSTTRIRCLRQEEANARQYARDMQEIERQLRRDHENIGRGLGYAENAPYAPRVMREAWEAPRYAYDSYDRYQRERERRRERRRRRN